MIPIERLREMAVQANDQCLKRSKQLDLRFVESIIEQVKEDLVRRLYKEFPDIDGSDNTVVKAIKIVKSYEG